MEHIIGGVVWTCGNEVTAYDIIGPKRWTLGGLDPEELGKWVFEGADPGVRDIPWGFRDKGCRVVVAGVDFGGGGKSIEHPIVAMKGAGITLVIAESFARYTYRNAINLGLPAIKCEGITRVVSPGDRIEADILTGEIRNLTTGESVSGFPLTAFVLRLLAAGGLLGYYKALLAK